MISSWHCRHDLQLLFWSNSYSKYYWLALMRLCYMLYYIHNCYYWVWSREGINSVFVRKWQSCVKIVFHLFWKNRNRLWIAVTQLWGVTYPLESRGEGGREGERGRGGREGDREREHTKLIYILWYYNITMCICTYRCSSWYTVAGTRSHTLTLCNNH